MWAPDSTSSSGVTSLPAPNLPAIAPTLTISVWVRNGQGGADVCDGFDATSMVRSVSAAAQRAIQGARPAAGASDHRR